jgi:hypothetical protein
MEVQRYAETLYPYDHPENDPNFFSFEAGQYFGIILEREDLQGWRLVINSENKKGIFEDISIIQSSFSITSLFYLLLLTLCVIYFLTFFVRFNIIHFIVLHFLFKLTFSKGFVPGNFLKILSEAESAEVATKLNAKNSIIPHLINLVTFS